MSDLVQRLRVDFNLDCNCQGIQDEAADQIEELEGQLSRTSDAWIEGLAKLEELKNKKK